MYRLFLVEQTMLLAEIELKDLFFGGYQLGLFFVIDTVECFCPFGMRLLFIELKIILVMFFVASAWRHKMLFIICRNI